MNDIKISGSGTIAGGIYSSVGVSGSARLTGDISCDSLRVSGSAHAQGNIKCENSASVSGSLNCDGSMTVGSLSVSGSLDCEEGITGGTLSVSGSCKIGKSFSGRELSVYGFCRTEGNCEAERAVIHGKIEVSGLLNAETIEIELHGSHSHVGTIGGSKIDIHNSDEIKSYGCFVTLFKRFFNERSVGKLSAETIEGDCISLSNTSAKLVSGKDIVIGVNCNIDKIEYSGSLTIDPSSKIGETVKTR